MKSIEKTLLKIRQLENQLAVASPTKAARLTSSIVRLKSTLFDKE
jgi:hypothetical protein